MGGMAWVTTTGCRAQGKSRGRPADLRSPCRAKPGATVLWPLVLQLPAAPMALPSSCCAFEHLRWPGTSGQAPS